MAISKTAANITILEGAVTRRFSAGGTINMGEAVYVASDGDVEQADANTAASVEAIGIMVATNNNTGGIADTQAASGDPVEVCVFGPVSGYSSLTPGTRLYVSETAGAIDTTAPSGAGTWTRAIGYAAAAGVVFVAPGVEASSSNS